MKDNTITASNGSEIYLNNIFQYADEYINTLNRSEDIYKKQCFAGMIKYISTKIRPIINLDVHIPLERNSLSAIAGRLSAPNGKLY